MTSPDFVPTSPNGSRMFTLSAPENQICSPALCAAFPWVFPSRNSWRTPHVNIISTAGKCRLIHLGLIVFEIAAGISLRSLFLVWFVTWEWGRTVSADCFFNAFHTLKNHPGPYIFVHLHLPWLSPIWVSVDVATCQGHPLHDFREKLLQKWPTIQARRQVSAWNVRFGGVLKWKYPLVI